MKQIAIGKKSIMSTNPSSKICEESEKLAELYGIIEMLERIYRRNELTGTSVAGDPNTWRKTLIEMAQQKLPLANEMQLLKCNEGEKSVVWIARKTMDFDQMMQLLNTVITFNELLRNEIESESKTGIFLARDSQSIISQLLKTIWKSDESMSKYVEIPIYALCLIWKDFEHNHVALKALIDFTPNLFENDKNKDNRMQLNRCHWYKTLESALNTLMHKLYSLIVHLSNVEQTISMQKQREQKSIENFIQARTQNFSTVAEGDV